MKLEGQKIPDRFIDYMRDELMSRHKKNPRYSLRAFSNQVQLSSSFISKLLNGKRPLTKQTFLSISARLALPPEIESYYLKREFIEHKVNWTKDSHLNFAKENVDTNSYLKLNQDQFSFISEWYHFAILELITVEGFIPNPNSIAAQLGISSLEAKESLDRLIRMKLIDIKQNKNGQTYFATSNYTTIDKKIVTSATQKQQKSFLKLAIDAVERVPIDERSQTSMTMAIPQSRLAEAEKLINNFRRDMTSILQRKGKRDSVYQLSISFFPLTRNLNKKIKR